MSAETAAVSAEHVPEPIPYADPKLPVGPTGFQVLSYPADSAGYVGGRVKDDGVRLSLEPTGTLNARWIPIFLVWLAWAVFAVMWIPKQSRSPTAIPLWARRVEMLVFVSGTGLLFWYLLKPDSPSRVPWITVDRMAKRVLLPRGKHSFPFDDVVRLQLVSFDRVGGSAGSLTARDKPDTGELQIVFRKSGKVHTWAVVSSPYGPVVKQFSVAFRQITGVPVSRAYRNLIGEWQIEPYDGEWDVAAPAV
jgi:hypothetical protein